MIQHGILYLLLRQWLLPQLTVYIGRGVSVPQTGQAYLDEQHPPCRNCCVKSPCTILIEGAAHIPHATRRPAEVWVLSSSEPMRRITTLNVVVTEQLFRANSHFVVVRPQKASTVKVACHA